MEKRSVSIAGHRTSISLEQPFWDELSRFATHDGCSIAKLIAAVDRERLTSTTPRNLSSSLRLYVLRRIKTEHIVLPEQN